MSIYNMYNIRNLAIVIKTQIYILIQIDGYSIHGRMVPLLRYRATSGERNFIEGTKAPIFLAAVLAIERM